MSLLTMFRLLAVLAYGVFPYLCLLAAAPYFRLPGSTPAQHLIFLAAPAAALFCLGAGALTEVSLSTYALLHAGASIPALGFLLFRFTTARDRTTTFFERSDFRLIAVVGLAFLVRALPVLYGMDCLGQGDFRFHNILAEKILLQDALSATWEPFAPIRVMYPQGVHVAGAFLARLSGESVHAALLVLLLAAGSLTPAVLYRLGLTCFGSRQAALWTACVYAFLPFWGSLDYLRWGGLPNAAGMLFLCTLAALVLDHYRDTGIRRRLCIVLAGLLVTAIMLVHHYSLIVTGLFLCAAFPCAADPRLRSMLVRVAICSALFCLPVVLAHHAGFASTVGSTNVLVFREPFLSLLDCLRSMNPAFVALAATALCLAPRRAWRPESLVILSWFTALLLTFVLLEYGVRVAVLAVTRGRDFFTCLTPSRMATNTVYPLSVLCGFLLLSRYGSTHRRRLWAGLVLIAAVTCLAAWRRQTTTGEFPHVTAIGRWARRHTPENSMLVGYLPHLEYAAWRETTSPPLPASEARRHPSVVWKAHMTSFGDWLSWEDRTGRPVFFLVTAPRRAPPCLGPVFRAGPVTVLTREGNVRP